MLFKAVEMNQDGVIHIGRVRERRTVHPLDCLNDGYVATRDTSAVTPQVIEELPVGCREILELGSQPAYHFPLAPGSETPQRFSLASKGPSS